MLKIWKYELAITDLQQILLPEDYMILSVANQNNTLCMWVEVDPDSQQIPVKIEIIGTGNPYEQEAAEFYRRFIGTVLMPPFVWHIFERIEEQLADDLDLRQAVISTFGGIAAISPEAYDARLKYLANYLHRDCDDAFKNDVREILKTLPCQLD